MAPPMPIAETLPEMSDRIAIENGIPTSTLRNLVNSESGWNPDWISDTGDVGLVQINIDTWHVKREDALDPQYSLEFAARKIKSGDESYWTVCNCYSLVKVKIPSLPHMADVVPNSTPHVGAVAIFQYGTLKHIAYVTSIGADGFRVTEANITPCLVAPRLISWNDPHLRGFWSQ